MEEACVSNSLTQIICKIIVLVEFVEEACVSNLLTQINYIHLVFVEFVDEAGGSAAICCQIIQKPNAQMFDYP